MSNHIEISLPDIGDYKNVPIVEIFVKPGDVVAVDTPLLAIESDKATMEVPSLFAGTVRELKVEAGTRVSEGMLLMLLTADIPARPEATLPRNSEPVRAEVATPAPASSKPDLPEKIQDRKSVV